MKSLPKLENSGIDANVLSYTSNADVGAAGVVPGPAAGFLPGAFFSASGCALISFGTSSMSKGSSDAFCAYGNKSILDQFEKQNLIVTQQKKYNCKTYIFLYARF